MRTIRPPTIRFKANRSVAAGSVPERRSIVQGTLSRTAEVCDDPPEMCSLPSDTISCGSGCDNAGMLMNEQLSFCRTESFDRRPGSHCEGNLDLKITRHGCQLENARSTGLQFG